VSTAGGNLPKILPNRSGNDSWTTGGSSNGRTTDFGSVNLRSNRNPPTIKDKMMICPQCRTDVGIGDHPNLISDNKECAVCSKNIRSSRYGIATISNIEICRKVFSFQCFISCKDLKGYKYETFRYSIKCCVCGFEWDFLWPDEK
jgi:hypothetical protein